MTQQGPVGPGKHVEQVPSLANQALPPAPERCTDHIRIQLPARASAMLSCFATTAAGCGPAETEHVINLPRSYAKSRAGKETLQLALLESVISDLASFARTGALPKESSERALQLVSTVLQVEKASETQVRAAIADAVAAARSTLLSRRDLAEKELRRLGSTGASTSLRDASSVTTRMINALCELRALHWLSPESLPHSRICDLGKPALAALVEKLRNGADDSLARANFDAAESFTALHEQIFALLQHGRLDRSGPSFLLPLPRATKPCKPELKTGLAALLRGAGTSSGYAPLASALAQELPILIRESRHAAEALKQQKAWSTQDESPTDELLEGLVDALPASAHELAALDPAAAGHIPAGVASCMSLLSRLRYHGTREGLITYAVMLGCTATQTELQQSAEYHADLVAPSWIKLVKATASWPHRSPSGRQALWAEAAPELKGAVARGLWVVSHMFAARLAMLLRERTSTVTGGLDRLVTDCESLCAGAAVLRQCLAPGPLADLMGHLETDVGPSLVRGFKALDLPEGSAAMLLEKSRQLPATFGESELEVALKDFCEHIHQEAAAALQAETESLLLLLRESFHDGGHAQFGAALDKLLLLAAKAPENSAVRREVVGVHNLTLDFVNHFMNAFREERGESEKAKLDALKFLLEALADIREGFAKHTTADWHAARENHLNEQVRTALEAEPHVSAAMLRNLCERLAAGDNESAAKLAQLLAQSQGCLRSISREASAEVTRFRHLYDSRLR